MPDKENGGCASEGCLWTIGVGAAIGIALTVLYFIVRFVKWAWVD